MPKKPTKWEIKVWCLTDSVFIYVWMFKVYCGANKEVSEIKGSKKGEAMQGANVVHRLLVGLENRGHMVVLDNFFSSISLFVDLLGKGTYTTSTVRANRIGLPTETLNPGQKIPLCQVHPRPFGVENVQIPKN